MTLFGLFFSIALGIGSLAWGYTLVGLPQIARWILLFGALWFVAVWQRWRWFATVGLIFNLLAAALGLWFLNFPPGWMFAGAIGGLLDLGKDVVNPRPSFGFANSSPRHHNLRQIGFVGSGQLSFPQAVGKCLADFRA